MSREHEPPSSPTKSDRKPKAMNPSKRKGLVGTLAGCIALTLSSGHLARAADNPNPQPASGIIEGRVSDLASGKYLGNARITVKGTTLETFSDYTGEYWLPLVPAGEAQVTATYAGMEPQSVVARVAPNQTIQQDFALVLAGHQ